MRIWLLVLALTLAAERTAAAVCVCTPKLSPGIPAFVTSDLYSSEMTAAGALRNIVRPVAISSYLAARQSPLSERFVPQWLELLIALGLMCPLVYISRSISQ